MMTESNLQVKSVAGAKRKPGRGKKFTARTHPKKVPHQRRPDPTLL